MNLKKLNISNMKITGDDIKVLGELMTEAPKLT